MPKALLTCKQIQAGFAAIKPQYDRHGVEAVLPSIAGQQLGAAEMSRLIVGMDAVIAGDDVIDASVLGVAAENGVKAVIKWGVGVDSIDLAAAKALSMPVYNTPGMFSDEVADLAMGLLLGIARRTHIMNADIGGGGWNRLAGRTLAGMCAGVVGLGSIGLGVARRATAHGMRVVGADVRVSPEAAAQGVEQLPLDVVLLESDVVFLACNLTAENRHLLNRERFARMREGAFVVNVARGPLIDETALADALASGRVAAAGLDVFEDEPLPAQSPLRRFPQCIFTAHAGSSTQEAIARVNQATTDILFHVLGLKPILAAPPNRVA